MQFLNGELPMSSLIAPFEQSSHLMVTTGRSGLLSGRGLGPAKWAGYLLGHIGQCLQANSRTVSGGHDDCEAVGSRSIYRSTKVRDKSHCHPFPSSGSQIASESVRSINRSAGASEFEIRPIGHKLPCQPTDWTRNFESHAVKVLGGPEGLLTVLEYASKAPM